MADNKFGMADVGVFEDLDVAKSPPQKTKPRVKTTAVLNEDTWTELKILSAREKVSLSDLLQEGAELLLIARAQATS